MDSLRNLTWLAFFWGVCGLMSGCGPNPVYHVQSELLPDGAVDRCVLQVDQQVFDAKEWDEANEVGQGQSFDKFDGDLTQVPIRWDKPSSNSSKVSHVLARKRVKAGDKVPQHMEIRREGLERSSTLQVERVVNDFGLLTEFRWTETLTEEVDLIDAAAARRELVDMVGDQLERTLKRYFAPDYDSTELMDWLRLDGSKLFERLYQVQLESSQQPRSNFEPRIRREFEMLFERLEVKLPMKSDADGQETFDFDKAVILLMERLVTSKVKRMDGQPIDVEELKRNFVPRDGGPSSDRFAEAWTAAMVDYPGGELAFKEDIGKLARRIWGLHGAHYFILGSQNPLRCVVKMPGVLVESNGTQLGDREVVWRFTAEEAFPTGYVMKARSISMWDGVLPGMHLDWNKDRHNWLALVELVNADVRLAEVLRKCRQNRSLFPLEKLAAESPDHKVKTRAGQALQILIANERP